jgi:hypothetical protein
MLFPKHTEVLVSAYLQEDLSEIIGKATAEVDYLQFTGRGNKGLYFNGKVELDSFNLSLLVEKADSFLPLIKGRMERTPMGSILFISYELFPSSLFFLIFWTIASFGLGLLFIGMEHKWIPALICFGICIGNYLFVLHHFKRKVAVSSTIFRKLLNPKQKD